MIAGLRLRWERYQRGRRASYAANLGRIQGGTWCRHCLEKIGPKRWLEMNIHEAAELIDHLQTCEKRPSRP